MTRNTKRAAAVIAAAFLCDPAGSPLARATGSGGHAAARPALAAVSPVIGFEENRGQADARVGYLARARGATLFLARDGATVALHPRGPGTPGAALGLALAGARTGACLAAEDELPGRVSYFRGPDPAGWIRSAPTYARVRYEEVYPGIDLVFHGSAGALEYDLVVRPGADPAAVRLRFEGAERLALGAGGEVLVHAGGRELVQRAPVAYQIADAGRVPVASRVTLEGDEVGFELGAYDPTRELVIDPVLGFSTYLGGSGNDYGKAVAVDGAGYVYVTGGTESVNFPTTAGAFSSALAGPDDVFVSKLDPGGSTLLYSTYLGGGDIEECWDLEVDSSGNAYVGGGTRSADFPTTAGAFDRTFAGGVWDGYVTKLSADGSALLYSTFLGGAGNDRVNGTYVDATGALFSTGFTSSTDFPTTPGAYDRSYNGDSDAFVTKLNAAGTALVYSTYLGGPRPPGGSSGSDLGKDVAVDASGNAYVCGSTHSSRFPTTRGAYDTRFDGNTDYFVSKLNSGGSALVYSTFLGGRDADPQVEEHGARIAVAGGGAAVVLGQTAASDFPTTAGAYDRVNAGRDLTVTKLNAAGSGLVYSTFVGGNADEGATYGGGLVLDGSGAAYVTASTQSSNFPTTPDALDATLGGPQDIAVVKLNPTGSTLVYGSYLGGTLSEESCRCDLGDTGSLYLGGQTLSQDFPVAGNPYPFQGTFQGGYADGCVVRIDF